MFLCGKRDKKLLTNVYNQYLIPNLKSLTFLSFIFQIKVYLILKLYGPKIFISNNTTFTFYRICKYCTVSINSNCFGQKMKKPRKNHSWPVILKFDIGAYVLILNNFFCNFLLYLWDKRNFTEEQVCFWKFSSHAWFIKTEIMLEFNLNLNPELFYKSNFPIRGHCISNVHKCVYTYLHIGIRLYYSKG